MANRAAFPPGDAREDWAIIRALSDVLGKKLPFDSLGQLRQAIFKAAPHLMRIDQIEGNDAAGVKALAARGGTVEKGAFKSPVEDFYLTNPIAPGVRGDGRMFQARLRATSDGGGVSVIR